MQIHTLHHATRARARPRERETGLAALPRDGVAAAVDVLAPIAQAPSRTAVGKAASTTLEAGAGLARAAYACVVAAKDVPPGLRAGAAGATSAFAGLAAEPILAVSILAAPLLLLALATRAPPPPPPVPVEVVVATTTATATTTALTALISAPLYLAFFVAALPAYLQFALAAVALTGAVISSGSRAESASSSTSDSDLDSDE